jgi:hypothetical protein
MRGEQATAEWGAFVPISYNDAEHWRQRAKEARAMAESLNDPQSKEAMLRIAHDYERLAERAEQRSKGLPHSN